MSTPAPGPDPEAGSVLSPEITQPAARRLARSAGLIGVATMTSRVLGLVRDQVHGVPLRRRQCRRRVQRGVPHPESRARPLRGGRDERRVRSHVHAVPHREGRTAAWRLGNHVVNALLVATALLVCAGLVFTQPLVTMFAEDYSSVPGKLELTVAAHADHAAVPDARGRRGGVHGHAELAEPVLRAGAVARDVQRREHPLRDPARAAHAAGRACRRSPRWRGRPDRRHRPDRSSSGPRCEGGLRYRPLLDRARAGVCDRC